MVIKFRHRSVKTISATVNRISRRVHKMNSNIVLSGLARRLVRDELITEVDARNAVEKSAKEKTPLPLYLVNQSLIKGKQIAAAAADEFGTPFIDLDALTDRSSVKGVVDTKLVQKHHSLPLHKRGNRLFVAVSDPTNLRALDEIKFNTGLNTEAVICEADKLSTAIEKFLSAEEESIGDTLGGLDEEALDDLNIEAVDEDNSQNQDNAEADEAPIVRFVNKVLLDAIKGGASDIHFEPYEKAYRVRYRTDGILHEVARPPVNVANGYIRKASTSRWPNKDEDI